MVAKTVVVSGFELGVVIVTGVGVVVLVGVDLVDVVVEGVEDVGVEGCVWGEVGVD